MKLGFFCKCSLEEYRHVRFISFHFYLSACESRVIDMQSYDSRFTWEKLNRVQLPPAKREAGGEVGTRENQKLTFIG